VWSGKTGSKEIDKTALEQIVEDTKRKRKDWQFAKYGPWISNVHVFHWEDFYNRFPLADGYDEWKQYIQIIRDESPLKQDFLLEFVPGKDQVQGFRESAKTLKKLMK